MTSEYNRDIPEDIWRDLEILQDCIRYNIPDAVDGVCFDLICQQPEFFGEKHKPCVIKAMSRDGIIYNANLSMLIAYPSSRENQVFRIPDHVQYVANGAFYYCPYLRTIVFPSTIKFIDYDSIICCDNIEQILIDGKNDEYRTIDGVLYHRNSMLYYPPGMKKEVFKVPACVDSLCMGRSESFHNSFLKEIESTTPLWDVFLYSRYLHCPNLERLSVSIDDKALCLLLDGVLYSKAWSKLLLYPNKRRDRIFEVPNGLEMIELYRSSECSYPYLNCMVVPASVESIVDYADDDDKNMLHRLFFFFGGIMDYIDLDVLDKDVVLSCAVTRKSSLNPYSTDCNIESKSSDNHFDVILDIAENELGQGAYTSIMLDDIYGYQSTKKKLNSMILQDIRPHEWFPGNDITGILLFGPDANVLSMFAKAIAAEKHCSTFIMDLKHDQEEFKKKRKTIGNAVKSRRPTLILENVDAEGSYDIWNYFYSLLIGKKRDAGFTFIMTSTEPWHIDSRILLLENLKHRFYIGLPDGSCRTAIIKKILHDFSIDRDLSLVDISQATEGMSGQDIVNLCISIIEEYDKHSDSNQTITEFDIILALERSSTQYSKPDLKKFKPYI